MNLYIHERDLTAKSKFLMLGKLSKQKFCSSLQVIVDKVICEVGFDRWLLPVEEDIVEKRGFMAEVEILDSIYISEYKDITVRLDDCLYLRGVRDANEYEAFYRDYINVVDKLLKELFEEDLSILIQDCKEQMQIDYHRMNVTEKVFKGVDSDAFLLFEPDFKNFVYYLPKYELYTQFSEGVFENPDDAFEIMSEGPDELATLFFNPFKIKEEDKEIVEKHINTIKLQEQFAPTADRMDKQLKEFLRSEVEIYPEGARIDYKAVSYLGEMLDDSGFKSLLYRTQDGYFVASETEEAIYFGRTLEESMVNWSITMKV